MLTLLSMAESSAKAGAAQPEMRMVRYQSRQRGSSGEAGDRGRRRYVHFAMYADGNDFVTLDQNVGVFERRAAVAVDDA